MEPAKTDTVLYEIVNPSDRCTMAAADERLARVACVLISPQYGLRRCDDGERVGSIYLFGLSEQGFEKEFEQSVEECLVQHGAELAVILQSVQLGGPDERVPDDEKEQAAEARRSSLNDIAGRAWQLGHGLAA